MGRISGEYLVRKLTKPLFKIPTLFLVMLIRAISPFVLIRFKKLDKWMAHILIESDLYLCQKNWKKENGKRVLDLFSVHDPGKLKTYVTDNQFVLKIVKRKFFCLHFSPFIAYIHVINREIPGWEKHECDWPYLSDVDGMGSKIAPFFRFTKREKRYGEQEMKKLSLSANAPYVCFVNREANYHKTEIGIDLQSARNSDIKNMKLATDYLHRQGIRSVRMGKHVKSKLSGWNTGAIDYAGSPFRSDFMDFFLVKKCFFMLSGGTTFISPATIFRKPFVFVNAVPCFDGIFPENGIIHHGIHGAVITFKLYWSKEKRRYLTLHEIVAEDLHNNRTEIDDNLRKANVEPLENTPDEIESVVKEMHLRLTDEWEETEEDLVLQKRFWSFMGKKCLPEVKIGAYFLRKHQKVLGI